MAVAAAHRDKARDYAGDTLCRYWKRRLLAVASRMLDAPMLEYLVPSRAEAKEMLA